MHIALVRYGSFYVTKVFIFPIEESFFYIKLAYILSEVYIEVVIHIAKERRGSNTHKHRQSLHFQRWNVYLVLTFDRCTLPIVWVWPTLNWVYTNLNLQWTYQVSLRLSTVDPGVLYRWFPRGRSSIWIACSLNWHVYLFRSRRRMALWQDQPWCADYAWILHFLELLLRDCACTLKLWEITFERHCHASASVYYAYPLMKTLGGA